VRILEVDGQRIEYLQFGRWGSPAWTVAGDKFVFAFYPQLVEDAVKHLKDGAAARSILDNPEYVAARKRTGDQGPMLYASGPEVTKSLYPVGLFVSSIINSFAGGFDESDDDDARSVGADLLPSMQRLLGYVGTDALAYQATPDGLLKTRTTANPLLSPMTWLDSPVLWLAIGIPSVGAAEDAADRERSAQNLRTIGQGIVQYANDNKDKFPPDLQAVVKAQELDQTVTRSPFGPAKGGADLILLNYDGKVKMNGPNAGGVVILYDQAALDLGDGTNVLYDDGHVAWLAPDAFKRALEESRKKVALLNAAP
jgi:hypothetical protein